MEKANALDTLRNLRPQPDFCIIDQHGPAGYVELNAALNGGLIPLQALIGRLAATRLPHALLMVSQFLSVPENLDKLVTHLLEDEASFAGLLKESYYHQNGFDKIVLLSGQGFKVRLHHFHAMGEHAPMENIHDHRWAFASTILQGRFDMLLFEDAAVGGERRMLHTYFADKSTGRYHTVPVGERRLKCIRKHTMVQGTSYIMLPHELHSIVHLPRIEAVTLIVTGNNERDTCKLYAKGDIEDEQTLTQAYDAGWMRNKLKRITRQPLKMAC